jgi:membrane protein implicated in regulation of membrane protease activity
MPELLGWWAYVVGVPLSGGALLTFFSLGGKGRKSGRSAKGAPKTAPVKAGRSAKTAVGKAAPVKGAPGRATPAKTAPGKTANRQTRAAELPPLFLLQNFLLIWSLTALAAVPFHPQSAAPATLAIILAVATLVSLLLLAVCARLFVHLTPVDASSITLKSDLQGRVGECDATTDSRRGSLLVRDEFGTLHHVAARSDEPIARGEAVLLIEYQPSGDFFQVRSWSS